MEKFVFILAAVVVFIFMFKEKRFVKNILLSSATGISALFAVNFIGSFIALSIPINVFFLIFSALFGLPGVITLVVFDTLTSVYI